MVRIAIKIALAVFLFVSCRPAIDTYKSPNTFGTQRARTGLTFSIALPWRR